MLDRARREVGEEVTNELYLSQIEIGTPVCTSLADARSELVRLRKAVVEAARRDGCRIGAQAGTHPFSVRGGPGPHAQGPLYGEDPPRLPADHPRADHLRLPRPRRDRRPRRGDPGDEPCAPVARADPRPVGELAILDGARHRLRQLPDRAVRPIPDGRGPEGPGLAGRVRRGLVEAASSRPRASWTPRRIYRDVRPSMRFEHVEIPGRRRLPVGRRGRRRGRPLPRIGHHLPRRPGPRRPPAPGPPRIAPSREMAGRPVRPGRRADRPLGPQDRPRQSDGRGPAGLRPARPWRRSANGTRSPRSSARSSPEGSRRDPPATSLSGFKQVRGRGAAYSPGDGQGIEG